MFKMWQQSEVDYSMQFLWCYRQTIDVQVMEVVNLVSTGADSRFTTNKSKINCDNWTRVARRSEEIFFATENLYAVYHVTWVQERHFINGHDNLHFIEIWSSWICLCAGLQRNPRLWKRLDRLFFGVIVKFITWRWRTWACMSNIAQTRMDRYIHLNVSCCSLVMRPILTDILKIKRLPYPSTQVNANKSYISWMNTSSRWLLDEHSWPDGSSTGTRRHASPMKST